MITRTNKILQLSGCFVLVFCCCSLRASETITLPSIGGIVVADADNDGQNEIVVGSQNPGSNNGFKIFKVTFAGFTEIIDQDVALCNQVYPAVGDSDNDGQNEIWAAWNYSDNGGGVKVYKQTGPMVWSLTATGNGFDTFRFKKCVAIGDIDNDGNNEIALAVAHYGRACYTSEYSVSAGYQITLLDTGKDFQTVHIADTDNDGQNELFFETSLYDPNINGFRIYKYNGSSFDTQADINIDLGGYCASISDIDGDGKNEIVLGHKGGSGQPQFLMYRWNGSSYQQIYQSLTNTPVSSLVTGDLLNNGGVQMACYLGDSLRVMEFIDGGFQELWSQTVPVSSSSDGNLDLLIADADNDGKNDLVAAVNTGTGGTLTLYHFDQSGQEILPTPTAVPLFAGGELPTEGKSIAFPSPARGNVIRVAFTMPADGTAEIFFWNEAMRLVARRTESCQKGLHVSTVEIDSWSSGIYFYRVVANLSDGQSIKMDLEKTSIIK